MLSREIRLKARPDAMPGPEHFELAETEIAPPGPGEVTVRNIWMSVDPYMRGRMREGRSYVAPFRIGAALEGGAVGEVVASNAPEFAVGDHVVSMFGWREAFTCPADAGLRKVDPGLAPLQAYLGVLGMPGMTAWAGLLKVGALQEGETVLVSAASGAVGSVVCQIAKAKNCTVAGIAGSDEKCRWLKDRAGVDAAINYRTAGSLSRAIAAALPGGVDVYFENVGGDHLAAALNNMKLHGRIALCGMIAHYNDDRPTVPGNLMLMIGRRLRMQGFIVSDFADQTPQFTAEMARWIADGKVVWKETVFDGIERAPEAFIGLFTGANLGKMLVRLGSDSAG